MPYETFADSSDGIKTVDAYRYPDRIEYIDIETGKLRGSEDRHPLLQGVPYSDYEVRVYADLKNLVLRYIREGGE